MAAATIKRGSEGHREAKTRGRLDSSLALASSCYLTCNVRVSVQYYNICLVVASRSWCNKSLIVSEEVRIEAHVSDLLFASKKKRPRRKFCDQETSGKPDIHMR